MTKTLRVSDRAYTRIVEIMGILQYNKAEERITIIDAVDALLEQIPSEWPLLREGAA